MNKFTKPYSAQIQTYSVTNPFGVPARLAETFDQLVKYFSCGGTLRFPGNLSFASKAKFNILPLFASPLSITITEHLFTVHSNAETKC